VGKTELVKQLHAQLGKTMLRANMNGDATRAAIVGEMQASPSKGTYFHEGALPIAMRAGATLLVDEVDYAPPHILAVFNSVLEGSRQLFVEETAETIVAAPGFMIMTTGNTAGKGDTNGNYTGTEVLNTAFLDRFPVCVAMDYLAADIELTMLKDRNPTADVTKVKQLVSFANEVRDSFKKGNVSITLSTRKLIDILNLSVMLGMDRSVELGITNWLDEDDFQLVHGLKTRVGL